MTTSTLQNPTKTISITASDGFEDSLLHIEGMPLEEYFGMNDQVKAMAPGEVALMDGVPLDVTEPVPAGATIVIGKMPING